MTYGRTIGGECGREGDGQDGVEWGGKWDNCNSIINKYILKNVELFCKKFRREGKGKVGFGTDTCLVLFLLVLGGGYLIF